MQISRMFDMLYFLAKHKTATAKELSEHFSCSIRTVYRDIDALLKAGVPLYTTRGHGGGVGILPGFSFDDSLISNRDASELLFAFEGTHKLNDASGVELLSRLSTVFKKEDADFFEASFSSFGSARTEKSAFKTLKEAILEHYPLRFTYYNSLGNKIRRKAEPLKLFFLYTDWYLLTYLPIKEDFHFFKLSRMENIESLKNVRFQSRNIPEPLPLKSRFSSQNKAMEFKLEFQPGAAYRIYDEFPQKNIQKKKNGKFLVRLHSPDDDFLYDYFITFGKDLKIISPESAAQKLCARAKAVVAVYDNEG